MRACNAIWTLCIGVLPAQDLVYRREGVGDQLRRGMELVAFEDINGDGWQDYLEWTSQRTQPGMWCCFANFVTITSGRDGSILSSAPLSGQDDGIVPESLTFVGDINQDGIPDYAYTSWYSQYSPPPPVYNLVVRSGRDHSLIWSVSNSWQSLFGWTIAGNLDVNGDGRKDVVISASRLTPNGTVIVYNHAGVELYRIDNPDPNLLIAVDLASLGGDLDGDGCDDFLMACPDSTTRGAVVVVSGRTGSYLRTGYGEIPGDGLYYCTGCGDIDGDGVLDFAGGGHWGLNCVRTFSGATGQPIRTHRTNLVTNGCGFGLGSQLSAADLDQDGINDLLACVRGCYVVAMSGRTGEELFHFVSSNGLLSNTCIGQATTILRAPFSERYPVVVYSEHCYSTPTNNGIQDPGLLWAYRSSPRTVTTFGQASSSTTGPARMGMAQPTGGSARFTMSDTPPGALAVLTLGLSNRSAHGIPLPANLAAQGLPGITLNVSPDVLLFTLAGTGGIDSGYARIEAPMQLLPTGVPVFAQWLWLDPVTTSVQGGTVGHGFRVR